MKTNHPAHAPVSLDRLHLNGAIAHADERADALSGPCAAQHAQLAAWLRELQERRKADSDPVAFFSYGSEHCFEHHKTAQDAIDAAEAAIDDYRGDAGDGWSEETDSICWGVIMQISTKVGERPRTKEDCCDPTCETVCDYALLPKLEVSHE